MIDTPHTRLRFGNALRNSIPHQFSSGFRLIGSSPRSPRWITNNPKSAGLSRPSPGLLSANIKDGKSAFVSFQNYGGKIKRVRIQEQTSDATKENTPVGPPKKRAHISTNEDLSHQHQKLDPVVNSANSLSPPAGQSVVASPGGSMYRKIWSPQSAMRKVMRQVQKMLSGAQQVELKDFLKPLETEDCLNENANAFAVVETLSSVNTTTQPVAQAPPNIIPVSTTQQPPMLPGIPSRPANTITNPSVPGYIASQTGEPYYGSAWMNSTAAPYIPNYPHPAPTNAYPASSFPQGQAGVPPYPVPSEEAWSGAHFDFSMPHADHPDPSSTLPLPSPRTQQFIEQLGQSQFFASGQPSPTMANMPGMPPDMPYQPSSMRPHDVYNQGSSAPQSFMFPPTPPMSIMNQPSSTQSMAKYDIKEEHTADGSKVFPCPYQPECQHSFSRRYDLIRHLRIHTDEKPFRCDRCNKSFTRMDALSRHLKVY
jgi:hypothetical protein